MDSSGSSSHRRSKRRMSFLECIHGHKDIPFMSKRCDRCSLPMLLKVPCTNAEFGCLEFVPCGIFGEISTHPDECYFTQCPCPFDGYTFSASYRDLYEHAITVHCELVHMFDCGKHMSISFTNNQRVVLKENSRDGGELVVAKRFPSPYGCLLAVSCIAPKVPEMGNLSFELTVHDQYQVLSFSAGAVNRVRFVSRDPSHHRYFPVPLHMDVPDDVQICIKRILS